MPRRLALLAAASLLLGAALPADARAGQSAGGVVAELDAGAAPLVALIGQARHSLDGEVVGIAGSPVLAALERAASHHVFVRLILAARPDAPVARALTAAGVQMRLADSRLLPIGGYLVADHARAWIGGMEWSDTAFAQLRGFAVSSTDAAVALSAEAVFAADWSRRPLRGSTGALIVSPINARASLTRLMRGARKSLDLATARIDDRDIEGLLVAAHRRGVRVREIGAGDLARLRAGGIQATGGGQPYAGTTVVADGQTVFIGGQTLTGAGLDHGRAVGLTLHDRAAIAAVERAFTADLAGPPTHIAQPSPTSTPTPTAIPTDTAIPTNTGTPSPPPPTPTASVPPTGTATATSTSTSFTVVAAVSPNPVADGAEAMLTAYSTPGASCTATVVYGNGSAGTAFQGEAQAIPVTGPIFWHWRVVTASTGGLATVTCTYQGTTVLGRATFIVLH